MHTEIGERHAADAIDCMLEFVDTLTRAMDRIDEIPLYRFKSIVSQICDQFVAKLDQVPS
jgi:hypothetical protein